MASNRKALIVIACVTFVAGFSSIEALPKRPHNVQSSNALESNEAVQSPSSFLRQIRTPAMEKDKSSPKSARQSHLRIRNSPPSDLLVPVTTSHVLECEAGGNPPPQIHWLKDGKRINQNLDEVLGLEDDDTPQAAIGISFTRSRLYLDCVQPHDAGVYTCVAENAYSRISSETRVKVIRSNEKRDTEIGNSVALCLSKKSYGTPARIHMWTRTRLEMIGTEARLFCRASGSPQPSMSWVGPDEVPIVTSDKYTVLSSGDLVIKDLSWADMGGYTCLAANTNGDDRSVTFLYPTMPEK